MKMCGKKLGEAFPVDDNVKSYALEVKAKVEEKLNTTFNVYEPVSYTDKVFSGFAGTHFKIKVKVDGDKYIHIKVLKPLPVNGTEKQLLDVQTNKTLNDPL